MAKAKKRKPDLRRIRTSKTYTLPEIAKTLDRNISTIRTWINQGLPVLSTQKPVLVLGSELKDWLQKKWQLKSQNCQLDELFCFKCNAPRKPNLTSVSIIPRNEKTVTIKGRCTNCNTRMNQTRSLTKLAELERLFCSLTPQMQRLTECSNTSVNRTKFGNNVNAGINSKKAKLHDKKKH